MCCITLRMTADGITPINKPEIYQKHAKTNNDTLGYECH